MKPEKVVKTKLNLIELAELLHENGIDDPTMTESAPEIGQFLNFIADPSLEKIFRLPPYRIGVNGDTRKFTAGIDELDLAREIYSENPHSPYDWANRAKSIYVRRKDWPQFIENAKKMIVEIYYSLAVNDKKTNGRGEITLLRYRSQ